MRDIALDFFAGWLGGLANVITGHPFDTVKVRIQTNPQHVSAITCIINTFKHEGSSGFFKGMAFPLLSVGAVNSIMFGVYGNSLRSICSWRKESKSSYSDIFIAGCIGGAATLIITVPSELIKTKLQVQQQVNPQPAAGTYNGPWHCLRSIYRTAGIRGCYQGFLATAIRDIPATGLYILTYEYLCDQAAGKTSSSSNATPPSPLTAILAGGSAGVISWGAIIPFDVIKSRLQSDSMDKPKYRGLIHCALHSYKTEGISVFFRGFAILSIRAFPTNACVFMVYSYSLHKLKFAYSLQPV